MAQYNAEKDEWTLYTKTELHANTFGCATAYYFGPDVFVEGTTFEEISIPATAPVFSTVTQYTMLGPNSVNMQATLKPDGVRIRFRYTSSLYNTMSVSQFFSPSAWNAAEDDKLEYAKVPQITQSEWANTEGDGYYYTPYYTLDFLPDNINDAFFRVYDDSFPTSTRVRLFMVSDDGWSYGDTFTVDLSSSPYRMGTYTSWFCNDITGSYENQTAPGTPLFVPFSSTASSKVGVHIEAKFTVTGYAPEDAGYGRKFGIRFESYDTKDYDTYSNSYTFTRTYEVGESGFFTFDYFSSYLDNNYSNYYNVYLLTDGVNVTFSDIKMSSF